MGQNFFFGSFLENICKKTRRIENITPERKDKHGRRERVRRRCWRRCWRLCLRRCLRRRTGRRSRGAAAAPAAGAWAPPPTPSPSGGRRWTTPASRRRSAKNLALENEKQVASSAKQKKTDPRNCPGYDPSTLTYKSPLK